MDTNKMREQFEKRIHQPAGSYWCEKDRTYRYEDYDTASSQIHECQWQAWIAAWQASRESVHIDDINPEVTELKQRIEDQEREQLFRAEGFVRGSSRASISALQRHFKIGYGAARRLMERLELSGVVAAPDADGRRRVLPMVAP